MNLYRHYRNKPYRVRGIAKHSEDLSEFVVYEPLYDNPESKLWIRPREMFFENVVVGEKALPRFEKVELAIIGSESVDGRFGDQEMQGIAEMMKEAFGQWDQKWFAASFRNHTRFYLLMAFIQEFGNKANKTPIGFKLGYEQNPDLFYSWLGGVIPSYRGLGVAEDLMNAQHEWCRSQGYSRVQTRTQNRFRAMLTLNIKAGFDIVGYHLSDDGEPKILLEKNLK
jgi:GNAT superfamily N-acetyltransferase